MSIQNRQISKSVRLSECPRQRHTDVTNLAVHHWTMATNATKLYLCWQHLARPCTISTAHAPVRCRRHVLKGTIARYNAMAKSCSDYRAPVTLLLDEEIE